MEFPGEYIHKLNTDGKGIYVLKINKTFDPEIIARMRNNLRELINRHNPGSDVIILSDDFSLAIVPPEEALNELGWIKKEA